MLNKGITVLNFDNSVIQQQQLFSQYPARVIDLTGLSSLARHYMPAVVRGQVQQLIPQENKYPVFIGSGDFHHVSEILTSRIKEPFCLIVFDFHPDWDSLPPRFGCGSWVSASLKNKNILKCVLIGAGSDDLNTGALQAANLEALAGDRLEIYPYRHKPSRVYFRRVAQNYSLNMRKDFFSSKISWRQLANEDLEKFTLELISRLPTPRVYISIDKDCLKKDFALTNWEEGLLRLEQLLIMLKLLRDNLDILGLDVVGDYSPVGDLKGMKGMISRIDHPQQFTGSHCAEELIRQVNARSNLAILNELFR
ncbi:MAG: hypothetical protein PHS66_03240 [Candidatus Omnitrophica bacterium]|nr:hypothetical protein [Candidatus Omnitrophota bacterium]